MNFDFNYQLAIIQTHPVTGRGDALRRHGGESLGSPGRAARSAQDMSGPRTAVDPQAWAELPLGSACRAESDF
jgi:hypothetical protein